MDWKSEGCPRRKHGNVSGHNIFGIERLCNDDAWTIENTLDMGGFHE